MLQRAESFISSHNVIDEDKKQDIYLASLETIIYLDFYNKAHFIIKHDIPKGWEKNDSITNHRGLFRTSLSAGHRGINEQTKKVIHKYINNEMKANAFIDFYTGARTVNEICIDYGISIFVFHQIIYKGYQVFRKTIPQNELLNSLSNIDIAERYPL